MTTAEKIVDARTDINMTQGMLAEIIGMSQQQLSGYERGTRNPSLLTLKRIASALGCDPESLQGDTDMGMKKKKTANAFTVHIYLHVISEPEWRETDG